VQQQRHPQPAQHHPLLQLLARVQRRPLPSPQAQRQLR
ncbi:unnamed protein product, partial [Didymodactylos carnosus]